MKKSGFILVGILNIGLVFGLLMGCASGPNVVSVEQELITTAETGDVVAQVKLADYYWGIDALEKALPWYMKASENGNASTEYKAWALFRVGRYYDRSGDIEKSVEWYTKAADAGNDTAQLNLGNYYQRSGDYKKAFELYLKAAEQGQATAEYNVYVYYSNGEAGVVEKDAEKAVDWLLKSYEHGSKDAEEVLKRLGLL